MYLFSTPKLGEYKCKNTGRSEGENSIDHSAVLVVALGQCTVERRPEDPQENSS